MTAAAPWLWIGSASAVVALCLMLGLKLISPERFAQILAGLGIGLTVGLALWRLPAGGPHG
ncbi:MAG: hypothetical protein DI531_13925 [Brevundimonas sp.]|jgi:hypothetical protein|nr:MAG: hypothetical protein DI531_13925 [Brevundimonas sp.]